MTIVPFGNWEKVKFSEIVIDSAFGPRFSGDAYADDGNIATLRTKDISPDGRISYETMPMARLDETKFSNHFLQTGDLVITRSGRVGTTAIFGDYPDPVLPGAFLIRFRLSEIAEPLFFRYWFNSQIGQQSLLSVARGAAQQNINITNVKNLLVPLPQVTLQKRIVDILSTYDNLIENNRRRIALLEQAARLLYKEWFVQLRFPGHEHVKIKDGVPAGWEKVTLKDVSESIIYGYTASANQNAIGPKFLRITDIVPDMIDWETVPFCEIVEKNLEKFSLQEGDVVVARTGATVGYAKRIGNLDFQTVFASYLVRFRFYDQIDNLIAGIFMESIEYKNFVINNAGGAAQPNANAKVLSSATILRPPKTIQQAFRQFAQLLFEQKGILQKEIAKLREARDLLLPRLMNGEIVV